MMQGIWNSRLRIPRCDCGAPDMVRMPSVPSARIGDRNVVVPPCARMMYWFASPEVTSSSTSSGVPRNLTTPSGWLDVLNAFIPVAIRRIDAPFSIFDSSLERREGIAGDEAGRKLALRPLVPADDVVRV